MRNFKYFKKALGNRSVLLMLVVLIAIIAIIFGVNYLKSKSDINSSYAGGCSMQFTVPQASSSASPR